MRKRLIVAGWLAAGLVTAFAVSGGVMLGMAIGGLV
jgi:hypothetical protein